MTKEEPKRRKTTEPTQESDKSEPVSNAVPCCELKFNNTSLGGMAQDMVNHYVNYEQQMIKEDFNEISRQEAKNLLEEQLYKYRAAVNEHSEGIEEEDAFKQIKDYFDQTENWLYEEGEDAPEQTYKDILNSFHEKMNVFQMWKAKFVQMKAKEEEKKRFMEQQEIQRRQQSQQHQRNSQIPQGRTIDPRVSRQIPVVYEGEGPYTRNPHQEQMNSRPQAGEGPYTRNPHQEQMNSRPQAEEGCGRHPNSSDHGYTRPSHLDPFFSEPQRSPMFERSARGNTRRSQMPEDPFARFEKPFFNDPLFGW